MYISRETVNCVMKNTDSTARHLASLEKSVKIETMKFLMRKILDLIQSSFQSRVFFFQKHDSFEQNKGRLKSIS